jgi:hypothetical protein
MNKEKQKWPVAGMGGICNPVIITKARYFVEDDDIHKMIDEVNKVMKKHGFEIDEISNNYYFHRIEEKAKAVDSLKAVILD